MFTHNEKKSQLIANTDLEGIFFKSGKLLISQAVLVLPNAITPLKKSSLLNNSIVYVKANNKTKKLPYPPSEK